MEIRGTSPSPVLAVSWLSEVNQKTKLPSSEVIDRAVLDICIINRVRFIWNLYNGVIVCQWSYI